MKTLLYFSQSPANCRPCAQMRPVINKLIDDGFIVDEIQAFTPEGEHSPLNKLWDIRSTPTAIIIENEEEVDRVVGARPYSFMLEKLKD